MKVFELKPGDEIQSVSTKAIFITQNPHPLYPELQLVVWLVTSSFYLTPYWSFDALSSQQEVGTLLTKSDQERQTNLQSALLTKGH